MRQRSGMLCGSTLGLLLLSAGPALAQTAPEPPLSELSIEELANLEVTSVSRAPQALSTAPAAIYVITREDIRRAGAQTIPEMLQLAPNLEVFQTSANGYVITARGFSGNADAQAFSNKLLVLIDGRSVYTPLFSGVYWDMQHVLPENVERIEVISGPGATLWGANAINGVINIITRNAAETQGASAHLIAGTRTNALSLLYGGRVGEDLSYRLYAQGFWQGESELASGIGADDEWRRPQAGFRLDWTPPGDNAFMLSGDVFRGVTGPPAGEENIAGHNLLGRWVRRGEGGAELRVQAYYDYSERENENDPGRLRLSTYDLDVQYAFALGERHDLVAGAGARFGDYRIDGTGALEFEPSSRALQLASAFVQDTITITSRTRLTLGVKAEDAPYSGVEWMPSVRLSWSPQSDVLVWAAASRAIRSPTPFDADVLEYLGGVLFLTGDPGFEPEEVIAYEAGLRVRPSSNSSLSISIFHNEYDQLRSIELDPVSGFLPLRWGNGMEGETSGAEIWADIALASWWRLGASYVWYDQDLGFDASSSGLLGPGQAGGDPPHRASLTSAMDLGELDIDAHLRYVDDLEYTQVPSYLELNGRIGWQLSERADLALIGRNLLDDRHLEFAPGANYASREFAIELRLRN